MGEVWLARRDDGFYEGDAASQDVEIGRPGRGYHERFAREGKYSHDRHPHIAHLLDAGIRPDGRRYLVLEYVAGERIDEYCDSRRLDIESRISLFLPVCTAVGTRTELVVHRD